MTRPELIDQSRLCRSVGSFNDLCLDDQQLTITSERGRESLHQGTSYARASGSAKSSRSPSSRTSDGRISGSVQTPVYLIVKRGYCLSRSWIGSKAASWVLPCPTTRALRIVG